MAKKLTRPTLEAPLDLPKIAAYLFSISANYNVHVNHVLGITLSVQRIGSEEKGTNARTLKLTYGNIADTKGQEDINTTLFETSHLKFAEAWVTVAERLITHKYERLEELEEALQSW
jgi:hypothetical protein